VISLVVEVAVCFVCMTVLAPNAKESSKSPSSMTDTPAEALRHASVSYRQAA